VRLYLPSPLPSYTALTSFFPHLATTSSHHHLTLAFTSKHYHIGTLHIFIITAYNFQISGSARIFVRRPSFLSSLMYLPFGILRATVCKETLIHIPPTTVSHGRPTKPPYDLSKYPNA
jgi:hypothetical protein